MAMETALSDKNGADLMSRNFILVTFLVVFFLGSVASIAYLANRLNEMETAMQTRPQVIVVDMLKLAADSVPVGSGEAAIKEHYRNTMEVVGKFRDAGFVVLNRSAVLAAPEELVLNKADLPPNKLLTGKGKE